jgi:hypothetical protein
VCEAVLRVGKHERIVQQQTAAGAWGSVAAQDEQLGVPNEQLQELRTRLALVRQEYRVKLDKLTEAMASQVGGEGRRRMTMLPLLPLQTCCTSCSCCSCCCYEPVAGMLFCAVHVCRLLYAAACARCLAASAGWTHTGLLPTPLLAGPGGDAVPGGAAAGGLRVLSHWHVRSLCDRLQLRAR